MAIDGILIHHLVDEIKPLLINGRINKINQINQNDVILNIYNQKNYNLLISTSYSAPRLYITNAKHQAPQNPFSFCMILRKHLERGIIRDIFQKDNDRIIEFTIENNNELGDLVNYHLIVEIMGRSSNLILTNNNHVIIDLMRKHFPTNIDTSRIMIPKIKYNYPQKTQTINPFIMSDNIDQNSYTNLEGVAKYHLEEIKEFDNLSTFLYQDIIPTIIYNGNKKVFSPYNLSSIIGEKRQHFNTISEMLEFIYKEDTKLENPLYNNLYKGISKKITLLKTKLNNLYDDLENAQSHLSDINIGYLLQANLHLIKKGMEEITLTSYEDDKLINVKLDNKKTPIENMQKYFKNYKKSVSANTHINEQITKTNNEIEYLNTILCQLDFANQLELNEISMELMENGYIKNKNKLKSKTNSLKNILKYTIEDSIFYVGKNNLQNNYLTNKFAKKNDYWFHVKDMPSAHVILQTNELNERNIRIAALLASLNSKYKTSSSVPVDYTQIKYIKKIPNRLGCFVTYTDQKTIYIDPSLDTLNKLLQDH